MNLPFQATSLIARNPQWTWQDFAHRCRQISQQLRQKHIQTVAFWFDDAAYFACAMLACFEADVKILLPPNLLEENRRWVEENADFLFDDALFETYGITQTVANSELRIDKTSQTEIWLKTSGSSGQPKIMKKTAEKMWQESDAISRSLAIPSDNNIHVVSSVSTQHHYGLSYRVMLPLTMGWSIARKQLPYPEYLIAESLSVPRSIWISSPALLTHLNLSDPALHRCQIVAILSSGGMLPETTAKAMRAQLNTKIIEGYGSTETGVIAFREQPGLWTPTPVTRLGVNEQGALWVESPWLEQREQTADAVEISGAQFHLLGRIDRIVKFGDKRISLVKIEQDILKHPWVLDAYVAQHPKYPRPAAWLALSEEGISAYRRIGRQVIVQRLRHDLSESQEHSALPRYWRFTRALPRNSQSKISRADFEQIFLNQKDESFYV